jgi:hypothetical protein
MTNKPNEPLDLDALERLAHRMAWRYKKSSDPHHSDTFTFNVSTLQQFALELIRMARSGAVPDDNVRHRHEIIADLAAANKRVIGLEAQVMALRAALKGITDRYVGLVNCGDCGNWDPESEPQVVAARAAMKDPA